MMSLFRRKTESGGGASIFYTLDAPMPYALCPCGLVPCAMRSIRPCPSPVPYSYALTLICFSPISYALTPVMPFSLSPYALVLTPARPLPYPPQHKRPNPIEPGPCTRPCTRPRPLSRARARPINFRDVIPPHRLPPPKPQDIPLLPLPLPPSL